MATGGKGPTELEGKVKIVHFWLMCAMGPPVHELMDDVKAVKFLPLKQAVETLSRPHEKVFLTHVGPIALSHAKKLHAKKFMRGKARRAVRGGKRSRNVPAAPVEHVIALDYGKTTPSAVRALGNWIGRAAQARKAG